MTFYTISKQDIVTKALESKEVWVANEQYMLGEISLNELGTIIQCKIDESWEALREERADSCDENYSEEGEELSYK